PSRRRLVSTATPTQISPSTPEAFAVSTATAGSTSIRNRWQWVSTAPDGTDSSGFFSPIGRGTYPVSTSGEQGELHVKRRWKKSHPRLHGRTALSRLRRVGRGPRPCS